MKVEDAVKVDPVGEFELKGIRRPLAAYNVIAALIARARSIAARLRQRRRVRNSFDVIWYAQCGMVGDNQ